MIKVGNIYISELGIDFQYRGDDIVYIWPWKRTKFNHRFISLGFDGVFSSLKEIDDYWKEYFEYLKNN